MTRPVWMFLNLMPRWKRPEAMPTKAMRSRCFGSILACTLNEADDLRLLGRDRQWLGRLQARRRGQLCELRSSSRTPKLLGLAFNLLDTLGHQDFSEVTHRG
jgi:hypothetical protein